MSFMALIWAQTKLCIQYVCRRGESAITCLVKGYGRPSYVWHYSSQYFKAWARYMFSMFPSISTVDDKFGWNSLYCRKYCISCSKCITTPLPYDATSCLYISYLNSSLRFIVTRKAITFAGFWWISIVILKCRLDCICWYKYHSTRAHDPDF